MPENESHIAERGAPIITPPPTTDGQPSGPMKVEKTKNKVCIVGCSQSKDEVPFNLKDEFEFWGVNNLFLTLPGPWTRWFEIHNFAFTDGKWLRRGGSDFRGQPVAQYLEGLQSLKCPVYMQASNPLVPNAAQYPLREVVESFGRYFTNTISWEIALAIKEGFEEIRIYGVDMAVDCLSPDSKVLTADLRWVQLGDVKVGDQLMGVDENPNDQNGCSRRWRVSTVLEAKELKKPCYEVGLDDGRSFIASENHGWLAQSGGRAQWLTTNQLMDKRKVSGRASRIKKGVEPWIENQLWSGGFLAAAFDGEGCLSQNIRKKPKNELHHMTLTYAQQKNPMFEKTCELLKANGYQFSVGRASGGNGKTKQINILGGKTEIMRFLGQFRPPRLLNKFKPTDIGELHSKADSAVAVIEKNHVGNREVIGLNTTTKTLIADGFIMHNSEYFWQRPSCEYFLGVALGKGIKLWLPDSCDLLKTRFLYGFEEAVEMQWRNKMKSIKEALKHKREKAAHQTNFHQKQVEQYTGALVTLDELDKTWKNVTGG
jgi:hypothetical protein